MALEPNVVQTPPAGSVAPPPAAPAGGEPAKPAATVATPAAPAPTLAAGGEAVKTPVTATFPDDWRTQIFGGDAEAIKATERLQSPVELGKAYKALTAKLNSGRVVTVPDDKATPEERAAYTKAIGVPDTPDGYIPGIKLSNNRVLGEADRPVVESFVKALHPAGATQEVVNKAADWYFDFQQAQADVREQMDAEYRVASEVALKSELGGNYAMTTNAIGTLFTDTPAPVMDALLNARTPAGNKLGDNPEVVKWLADVALKINPAASVQAPDGNQIGALNDEISKLAALSANQNSEYWEGPNAKRNQARYAELLDMRDKIKNRAA